MARKKNSPEEINTKINNCWQRILDAEKKQKESIDSLNGRCELLKNYIASDFELTRKYIQSMSYIEHFNFKNIYSVKLREETKKKKYKDISAYMSYHSYKENALNFKEKTFNDYSLCVDGYKTTDANNYFFKPTPYIQPSIQFNDDVESFTLGGQEVKINKKLGKEKESYKYEETIEYVVNKPYEFNEDIIISVVNYLKDISNKDAEIEKYENGGND